MCRFNGVCLSYKYPIERETHFSLLIGMGFPAVDIAGKMGRVRKADYGKRENKAGLHDPEQSGAEA